jgi:hypothetical protein
MNQVLPQLLLQLQLKKKLNLRLLLLKRLKRLSKL